MDRSLRRRGELLVLAGALLGALVGVTLGLAVDDTGTEPASAVPPPGRAAASAATPPTTQPPSSPAPVDRPRRQGGEAGDHEAQQNERVKKNEGDKGKEKAKGK